MFTKFKAHWTIGAPMKAVMTFEFMDLYYFTLNMDLKLF